VGKNYEDRQYVFPVLRYNSTDVVYLKTAQKLSAVDSSNNDPKQKLATFTHIRKGVCYITKLFKHSTSFAYKTNSSLNAN
jgi:hypothetical protein